MTLHELENAVSSLTADDLAKFRSWFVNYDAAAWDSQIERDMQAGRLDALADAALDSHRQGKTQEL